MQDQGTIRISPEQLQELKRAAETLGTSLRALLAKILWDWKSRYPEDEDIWQFWKNGR